jgi:nicotinamide-nucleotide amidase
MTTVPAPCAEILAIGDELIHGALVDTNSRAISRELEAVGVHVVRFTVVGDDPGQLRDALALACSRADLVVATGGIGPTDDDRTREVAAELTGGQLEFHAPSWAAIEGLLRRRNRPVPDSNRRQAMMPRGASVLDNPIGTAPGFRVHIGRAELFSMPGVPREMLQMLRDHVLPFVCALPGRRPVAQHCMRVLGPSEALLGERIAAFMAADRNPIVGVTASAGLLTLRIVGSASTFAAAHAACLETAAALRPLLEGWLVAEGTEDLHELVARRLSASGVSLALAESCTGGMLAARFTDVPGISAVFRGGVVCYSDEAKRDLLGVPADLLAQHGAVAEEVAAALARGAANRFGAELGLAITGIAGPDGGSPGKPIGTVCFGLSVQGNVRAWTVRIPDLGRQFVRERSVVEALVALLRAVPGPEALPGPLTLPSP